MRPGIHPSPVPERRRLDAWKGIAQYLGRDVTTVRRWEKREGLPVHRHLHDKLGSVYAFTDEIDQWWRQRSAMLEAQDPERPAPLRQVELIPPRTFTSRHRRALWSGICLLLVLATTVTMRNGPWPSKARAHGRVVFAVPAPAGTVADSVAIAPDGRRVAFAARDSGGLRLWLREIESSVLSPLPSTEGAAFPFWSADGGHIGFFTGGRLKSIDVVTHELRDVAPAPNGRGGTWNERGEILFAPDSGSPLMRVSSSGGEPTAVTKLGTSQVPARGIPRLKEGHAWPQFLPDGRRFLYTDYTSDTRRRGVYVGDLDTDGIKQVAPVYSAAQYADGYLVYSVPQKVALVAQAFNLDRLEVVGEPFTVLERPVHRGEIGHFVDFSLARTGTLIARSADEERNKLVWIDRASRQVTGMVGMPGWYFNPVISPDGRTLVTTVTEGEWLHLWLFDIATGKPTPLTSGKSDAWPLWSPGGERMLFFSLRDIGSGLYDRNLATGEETQVFKGRPGQVPESWSRDDRYLTFGTVAVQTKWDIWAWKLEEPRRAFPVVTGPGNDGHSRISPDGQFIAYASDESGRFEVYVRTFPTSTEAVQISSSGGADPRWRRDGRELYFLAPDGKMMAVKVSVSAAGTFKTNAPVALFDTGLQVFWQDTRNHYDVTWDGQRFIVIVPDTDRRYGPYTAIVNWQK